MTFLTNADVNFLMGNGPKAVERKAGYRKQGNGKFTGFVRTTWSDGRTSDHEFVVNAESPEDVRATYAELGLAA